MTLRGILLAVLSLWLACAPVSAQVNPGTSPLSGKKGGTNNGFMQFAGPASAIKTFTLPNASGTIGVLNAIATWTAAQSFSDGTVILLGSSSGSSTLKAPSTGGGTATLFAGSDTIVGLAATQTLTNKTLTSPAINAASLSGTFSGNPTFSGAPSLTGISSGTCSNSVLVNSAGLMITGACPGAATSIQPGTTTITGGTTGRLEYNNSGVLGEATLTGPLQLSGGAVSLNATTTAHGVPIFEGAAAMGNTGTGTLGQSLQGNGGSADPTYKSGGWTLLNTVTAASSANIQDTTSLTSSYSEYEIVISDIICATASQTLLLRNQLSGSFQTTGYQGETVIGNGSTVAATSQTAGITVTGNSLCATSGNMSTIFRLSNAAASINHMVNGTFQQSQGALSGTTGGLLSGTGPVTGVELISTSGNLTSGTMKIYGKL